MDIQVRNRQNIQNNLVLGLLDVNFKGTVEPTETFLSSFYGTTPGVQPLSFAREWREKNDRHIRPRFPRSVGYF